MVCAGTTVEPPVSGVVRRNGNAVLGHNRWRNLTFLMLDVNNAQPL